LWLRLERRVRRADVVVAALLARQRGTLDALSALALLAKALFGVQALQPAL